MPVGFTLHDSQSTPYGMKSNSRDFRCKRVDVLNGVGVIFEERFRNASSRYLTISAGLCSWRTGESDIASIKPQPVLVPQGKSQKTGVIITSVELVRASGAIPHSDGRRALQTPYPCFLVLIVRDEDVFS